MLEHKVFAKGILKDIKDYLPPDYADVECMVMKKRKNNGVIMVGLAFQKPGERMSPVIYVEPFYQEMCQGKPRDAVMGGIAETVREVMEHSQISNLPDIENYENAKEYLEVQIVNTRANRKELTGLAHRENEDLSLLPVLKFRFPEQHVSGTVKVSNELMEQWKVSMDMVMDQAWKNTRQKEPPTLRGLGDVMHETTMENSLEGNLLAETSPVQEGCRELAYVLSNRSGINGAAYLSSPETMEKICGLFPEGFYLLPSSVHEVLVMPKCADNPEQDNTPLQLGQLVRDINQTELKREEILSDCIYEYDKESRKIRQVPESIEKEREMER